MATICITDDITGLNGLEYIKNSVSELTAKTDTAVCIKTQYKRCNLSFDCPEYYSDILFAEVADRVAEVIAVGYKYKYFTTAVKVAGLSDTEREILLASLIAADLAEDKKYAFDRIKTLKDAAIDGVFNFRMKPLRKKWKDIAEYMPAAFIGSQLKDFVSYLLENKKKRTYIDDCKVYDNYYRRLKRCSLLGGEDGEIVREVLLSNCGEVEIRGTLPPTDEKYLKDFYGDRVYFAGNNASF
ncbi:MAG: hypothetical protein J5911_03560 [Clostridia bacterium]|nr:hypothetical protein [Clostridia bacterium]